MAKTSAKDLAFAKERAKYQQRINELESCLKRKNQEIDYQTSRVVHLEGEVDTLKNWVGRLLDYCNMEPEELKKIIESEKKKSETYERLSSMLDMFSRFSY